MENRQSDVQGAELEELDRHRLVLMRIYFARFGLADREALAFTPSMRDEKS